MSRVERPQVLIVGASLAGCCTALGLHRQGWRVLLVERHKEPRWRFRGEYLQPFAVQAIKGLGLGEIFAEPGARDIRTLRFRDLLADGREVSAEASFAYPDHECAKSIRQHRLAQRLRRAMREDLGESFVEGGRLRPLGSGRGLLLHRPRFHLEVAAGRDREVRPEWVIGCDGRQSTVRRWIGGGRISPTGPAVLGGSQDYLVGVDILGDAGDRHQVNALRTDRDGTLCLFGIGDGLQRLYWNLHVTGKKISKSVLKQALERLLGRYGKWLGDPVPANDRLYVAPANRAWMGPAHRGRFMLAGDALAVTSPLGGQGMTCALDHATSLVELAGSPAVGRTQVWDRKARVAYSRRARKRYVNTNLVNFFVYHLVFSKSRKKRFTRHVVGAWADQPSRLKRLGEIYSGHGNWQLKTGEIYRLTGIHKLLSQGLQREPVVAELAMSR